MEHEEELYVINALLEAIEPFDGEVIRRKHLRWQMLIPLMDPETDQPLDWLPTDIAGAVPDTLEVLFAPVIGATDISLTKWEPNEFSIRMYGINYKVQSLVPGISNVIDLALAREKRKKSLASAGATIRSWHKNRHFTDTDVLVLAEATHMIIRERLQCTDPSEALRESLRRLYNNVGSERNV